MTFGRLARALAIFAMAAAACPSCEESDAGCDVDTDCAAGLVCRDRVCVGVADGGLIDAAAGGCLPENAACTVDEGCCSRRCQNLRCTTPAPSEIEAGAPRCMAQYELCLSTTECCLGLVCQTNTCR